MQDVATRANALVSISLEIMLWVGISPPSYVQPFNGPIVIIVVIISLVSSHAIQDKAPGQGYLLV